MSKSDILLAGASGKMGTEILALIEEDKDLQIAASVDIKRPLTSVKAISVAVAIDFSSPEFSLEVAEWCKNYGIPLVCGTTGFTEEQFKKILKASERTPVLYASNMSVGVAILRRALRSLKPLSKYDFQVIEFHHIQKKDAPSGTAKTLQVELEKILGKKLPPVVSVRGGGIFGIHQIQVMGEEETLELNHTALNRAVFARGAILAAKFLINQKPGLYSIVDVLDHND